MRSEKQLLLDEIKEEVDSSEMVMVMSYQNLDANKTANFRSTIFKSGASMLVVKKRVFLKAVGNDNIDLTRNDLAGHIGIVVANENPVATTKSIYKFIEENKDSIGVLGGKFQGKSCSGTDFEKISKLPTVEAMRSQLLAVLEAPMSQTLSVMNALLTSVLHCIENKAK